MREITIRITRRRYSLVNLEDVDLVPRELFVG